MILPPMILVPSPIIRALQGSVDQVPLAASTLTERLKHETKQLELFTFVHGFQGFEIGCSRASSVPV
jgi:hypothetical protein